MQLSLCLGPDLGSGEDSENEEQEGVLALLRKYLNYLCTHVLDLLPAALDTSAISHRHYLATANILDHDIVGVLLPELVVSFTLLQLEKSGIFNRYLMWLVFKTSRFTLLSLL